jgi:O-antigen ligase
VSLPQLVALSLVASAAVRVLPGARAGAWAWCGVLFVAAALPAFITAAYARPAVTGLLEMVAAAVVLLAVVRLLVAHAGARDRVALLLAAGAALSVIPAIVQVVFGIGPAAFRAGGVMRAWSTFTEPNTYGLFLAGVLPVALTLKGSRSRTALFAGTIALGLVLTGSRAAWAGALAGLCALWLAAFRPRASVLIASAAAIALLAGAVLLAPRELVLGRLNLDDWSTQQRLLILLTAWDGIVRSPLLGWGPGAFEHMLPAIARQGLIDDVTMPHNLLLHIWFELGLAALICFTILAGLAIWSLFRASRRTRDLRVAGLLGGIVAMLVAAQFGTLFVRGAQETFILLVALSAAHLRGNATAAHSGATE